MLVYFANSLQNVDACAEITDMKNWQLEVNVAVVSNTSCQLLSTSLTLFIFHTGSLLIKSNLNYSIQEFLILLKKKLRVGDLKRRTDKVYG